LHFSEQRRFSVDNFGDSLSPAAPKPYPTRLSTTCLFIWQFEKFNEINGLEIHENVACENSGPLSRICAWVAAVHKFRIVRGGEGLHNTRAGVGIDAALSDCRSSCVVQFILP